MSKSEFIRAGDAIKLKGFNKKAMYPAKHPFQSTYGSICFDNDGVIWLTTRKGMAHVKTSDETVLLKDFPKTKVSRILLFRSSVMKQLTL